MFSEPGTHGLTSGLRSHKRNTVVDSIPCYKDGVGWKEGLTQGWQVVSRQHPVPQSWGCRSTWTNSPSDEGLSSLTHKEISVSHLIQDFKEESFREDTKLVHMNFRGQNRLRNQSACLTQSSVTYRVYDLEQDPYTLCIVALSVKEELYLCIDDRVLVRIK